MYYVLVQKKGLHGAVYLNVDLFVLFYSITPPHLDLVSLIPNTETVEKHVLILHGYLSMFILLYAASENPLPTKFI